MPSRLDLIRARLNAATPGPWAYRVEGDGIYINAGTRGITFGHCEGPQAEPDAALIAHAPEDVRLLLDVAEAAKVVAAWSYIAQHGGTTANNAEAQALLDALAALDGETDKP